MNLEERFNFRVSPSDGWYALVDCNNFYCSCERVYNPSLKERPIVVLSNNDGCIIARSNEAKLLGIGMGEPYFKMKSILQKHKITAFSSNYELYGDLSHRVMETLRTITPYVEVYSVDEAFTFWPHRLKPTLDALRQFRERVIRWTGVPVSIGLAPTKTLAKVAAKVAKKRADGCYILEEPDEYLLQQVEVEDIWGVGRRYARKLRKIGVHDAAAFAKLPDDDWIRSQFTVVGLRTVYELRGISCLGLEMLEPERKGICHSRAFSQPITNYKEMREAFFTYLTRASTKLRSRGLYARAMQIWLQTNRFAEEPYYSNAAVVQFPVASQDFFEMSQYLEPMLQSIYTDGYRYKKIGILFLDLCNETGIQPDLFDNIPRTRNAALLNVMDRLNSRYGKLTVHAASCGKERPWEMRREKLSPVAPNWRQLAVVKAK